MGIMEDPKIRKFVKGDGEVFSLNVRDAYRLVVNGVTYYRQDVEGVIYYTDYRLRYFHPCPNWGGKAIWKGMKEMALCECRGIKPSYK